MENIGSQRVQTLDVCVPGCCPNYTVASFILILCHGKENGRRQQNESSADMKGTSAVCPGIGRKQPDQPSKLYLYVSVVNPVVASSTLEEMGSSGLTVHGNHCIQIFTHVIF